MLEPVERCERFYNSIGEFAHAPVTYHVGLHSELVRQLEAYAASQHVKPETIIAEAVRAYLGADA